MWVGRIPNTFLVAPPLHPTLILYISLPSRLSYSRFTMEEIRHRTIPVNGINIHIAEKGEGQVVLLLHGFPELWYSWRHQILSLASWGYRAIAPDLRGFGESDAPSSPHSYTSPLIIGDLIAVLDYLAIDKVYLVGHDWGAYMAWQMCLFRPDRIKALVNFSVPFMPRNPFGKPIAGLRGILGDDYYMCRFQEPGEMEAEFSRVGTETVMKRFLTLTDPGPLMIPKETGFPTDPVELPSWLSQEDVNYYISKFEHRGFTGGLNYYRAFDLTWELTAAWTGAHVKVPTKFVIGDQDLVYYMPGTKEYIHSGAFKKAVPLLEEIVVMEGAHHFINQEKADAVSLHIYDFIKSMNHL